MATTSKVISWSFSKAQDFTRCKLAYKLKHIDKIPEPARELPRGKSEFANDRGSRIHDNIETYIRGDHDALCEEAEKHFGLFIDLVRVLYQDGMVELEGEWGFSEDWEITEWNSAYLRMKLDLLIRLSPTQAYVLDWKTGRHFGNEVVHSNQLNLYAVATFLRHPELEEIFVADYYIDHGNITERAVSRWTALRNRRTFDKQGKDITSCVNFPANPNKFSCNFCSWKETEHCTVGVKR